MNARILVVEDEEALTTLLRYNLDAEGYDVETVARGDDADTRLKERVPALVVLELVSRSGKRLSELLAPLHERYHLSGEINSTVADVPLKLQEIKERYGAGGEGGRLTHLDGVSVDFDDWHFNVRPSNTEPLLRLTLESLVSQEDMEAKRDEVLGRIRS